MSWVVTPEQFLNMEQVKKLRDFVQARAEEARKTGGWHAVRDWMMLDLALSSGLRASELAALQVGDLVMDKASPSIIVRRGKGGRVRVVKIGEPLRQHIEEYLVEREAADRADTPCLLPGQRGRWTRHGIGRAFKNLAHQAGLPARFSIHSCRHTYATMLLRASGSLRLVQKALGHASPTTTSTYADVIDQDAQKAANRLYGDAVAG
jgi:site-specific recombinase XerD